MKHSGLWHYAFGILAALSMLSGCGGSPAQITPPGTAQQSAANDARATQSQHRQVRYSVVFTGTLGGVAGNLFGVNQAGLVAGNSWLPGSGRFHTTLWKGKHLIDLGTLGGQDSEGEEVNDLNVVAGYAETATADPLGEDFCGDGTNLICSATLWRAGKIFALRTFGGNNGEAQSNNDRDQTVGAAETTVHDPTCKPPQVLQYEAATWTGTHRPQQLPTYPGDPDSSAWAVNENGVIVGQSGRCTSAHQRVVMWRNGKVMDLGGLGGTYGAPFHINDRDEVIGYSNLTGDATYHAFFWHNGTMTDLSPLPGASFSAAFGMNEAGHAVGGSWSQKGNHGHFATYRAVIWQHGEVTDLNTLVPTNSLPLLEASKINDSGEIVGIAYDAKTGTLPGFVAITNR